MIFIEYFIGDDELALEKLIKDSSIGRATGVLHFGKLIIWKHRSFRELCLSGTNAFEQEDAIFNNWQLPRVRLMVGNFRGDVFTTPPDQRSNLAARVKEGGRCGSEYFVRLFHYTDDDPEA